MNKVEKFIKNFKTYHTKEVEDLFLHGNCYWFADILERQFDGEKYYETTTNHFVTKIDGEFYDIRGKIEPDDCDEDVIKLEDYESFDELDYKKIIKYCKDLED